MEYSRRWRFRFNFGPDKSAVMVFGGVREGEEWWLGEDLMTVVDNYRYLGVRLVTKGRWKVRRGEAMTRATKNLWRAWGPGMGRGELSASGY